MIDTEKGEGHEYRPRNMDRRHFLQATAAVTGGLLLTATELASAPGIAWAFGGAGEWHSKRPTSSPPARHGAALGYDEARGVAVLFGGAMLDSRASSRSDYLGDTWIWDGSDWARATAPISPSARAFPSVVYDAAREQLVLFGGAIDGYRLLSDTWTWDGGRWIAQHPQTIPTAQAGGAMAFDERQEKIMLFGLGGETWTWDGVNWLRLTPTQSPSPRGHAAIFSDRQAGRVLLVGGLAGSGLLGDVWSWDGKTWSLQAEQQLPVQAGASAAFDVRSQRAILFGGAGAQAVDCRPMTPGAGMATHGANNRRPSPRQGSVHTQAWSLTPDEVSWSCLGVHAKASTWTIRGPGLRS